MKRLKFNASTLVLLIVAAIFLLIGINFFSIGTAIQVKNWNFKKTAVQTEGTITDIIRYRSNSDDSYSHEVYVSFTVRGVEFEGRINEWNSGMYKGQPITIYYDPDNPWNFQTDTSTALWILIAIGFVFLVVAIVAIIKLFFNNAGRKKLLTDGRRIYAEITDVVLANVQINNRYCKVIICEYTDEMTQTTYRFKSEAIKGDPARIIQQRNITQLPVYWDRHNIKRYYVDISSLENHVVDLS